VFLKTKKWIWALCLLALVINFLACILFFRATWDKNNLIFGFSLGFLVINLFCVIPLGFPLYFPLATTKSIKRKLTKDISSLKNIVLITKTAQFLYDILLMAIWGFAIIMFSIAITGYIFGHPEMIDNLLYPMLASVFGTVLLLLHTGSFASLMGYPILWRLWPSSKQSFYEEINEAKMFLLFSRRLIKKKYKEGITLLAHSLLILNGVLTREERWTTSRRIEVLYPTLEMLEAIETTDYGESKKSVITDFQEKILTLIDKKKLHELPITLSNFVNEKELEPFQRFSARPKTRISDRLSKILVTIFASVGSLLSNAFFKTLQVAIEQYPQLLCFVSTTVILFIVSYLFVYRRPATSYPLPINIISALSKRS
jgi:hypothetical protein